MTEFRRCIHQPSLDVLELMATSENGNWWKDLLRLWIPSGTPNSKYGLRLAVRNNYLNFYAKGQSIARVGFNRQRQPYAETHVKYVFEREETEQKYVRLGGTAPIVRHPSGARSEKRYQGEKTLLEWIEAATSHSSLSREKERVEAIVGANQEIIDLEMGLPATRKRGSALRMDCVALESEGDTAKVVFWEAKLINDSRLRAKGEPKVVKQIKSYREDLSEGSAEDADSRQNEVIEAYRENCRLMMELNGFANVARKEVGQKALDLGDIVQSVVNGKLKLLVDPEPRLAILKEEPVNKNWWETHEPKLREEYGVSFITLECGANKLYKPESKR